MLLFLLLVTLLAIVTMSIVTIKTVQERNSIKKANITIGYTKRNYEM
jgi:ABC-type proline/glycine betaine transport system permease subunit